MSNPNEIVICEVSVNIKSGGFIRGITDEIPQPGSGEYIQVFKKEGSEEFTLIKWDEIVTISVKQL